MRFDGPMPHAVRPVRVLVADPDPTVLWRVRAALAGCADLSVLASPGDGVHAAVLAAQVLPDVALVGEDPRGIGAIAAASPATNVVVLATAADRERIIAAVDAGAGGYLLRGDDPAGLPDAVRAAARGESPLAPAVARALIAGHRLARRDARLPAIEKRVLALLGRGCTDAEIRELLDLTAEELDRVLDVIIGALGVADRTQAALWAQRQGYDGAGDDPGGAAGPFDRGPGRFPRPARPSGKRSIGRPHDAESCEERPRPLRGRRDGADPADRRLR